MMIGKGSMRGISLAGSLAVTALLLFLAPSAHALTAEVGSRTTLVDGTQKITYKIPLNTVTSGQNRIRFQGVNAAGKPNVNGWITAFDANLVYSDGDPKAGQVPSSSIVMFHHGVFLSNGGPFFATGEEKTAMVLPDGYGYRYNKNANWTLNEMIHNLQTKDLNLTATYTISFIPDSAPEAADIKPAKPIWMDVQNGHIYPVFDILRDSGGADGKFSYPQDVKSGYPTGLNTWTAPEKGVLLGTTGHVHTGGLNTELFMTRSGAGAGKTVCPLPKNYDAEWTPLAPQIDALAAASEKVKGTLKTEAIKKHRKTMTPKKMKRLRKSMPKRKFKKWKSKKVKRLKYLKKINASRLAKLKATNEEWRATASRKSELEAKAASEEKAYDTCTADIPRIQGDRVRLFESKAHYFEPAGPVSWDMAMISTKDDWKVQVQPGDKLDLQATYETKIGSWYESMGINVVFWAQGEDGGRNPYNTKVDTPGVLNHGHYAENDVHGGDLPAIAPDPATLPDGLEASSDPFDVGAPGAAYTYEAGGFNLPGANGRPPVVEQGKSLTFELTATDDSKGIWHSLTSCKAPCNKSTGIAYPIADGDFQFDSGQLGIAGPPTVGRRVWSTPPDTPVGTHTFFCRIHPLMRGSFRVKPKT